MFGAGCQHEACGEQDFCCGDLLFGHQAAGCIQWPTHHATSAVISLLSGYLFGLESGSLVFGACMQPASRQQGADFIGWLKGERQCLTHPGNIAYNW